MKTIADLATFVKRNGSIVVSHDGTLFVVDTIDTEAKSKYLDDALNNLTEELRRKANDTVLRETEPTLDASLVVAACGVVTAIGGTCPKCNSLPHTGFWTTFHCGGCGAAWPVTAHGKYAIGIGPSVRFYTWDGNEWKECP